MNYTVFQIRLTDEMIDFVNAVGHRAAAEKFPAYKFHMDTSHMGAKGYHGDAYKFYDKVATIEADSLEDVFTIGNIGPEHKITRHERMHSISVGDIVWDGNDAHIVDCFGFVKVTQ